MSNNSSTEFQKNMAKQLQPGFLEENLGKIVTIVGIASDSFDGSSKNIAAGSVVGLPGSNIYIFIDGLYSWPNDVGDHVLVKGRLVKKKYLSGTQDEQFVLENATFKRS